jgi:hypothetical protein
MHLGQFKLARGGPEQAQSPNLAGHEALNPTGVGSTRRLLATADPRPNQPGQNSVRSAMVGRRRRLTQGACRTLFSDAIDASASISGGVRLLPTLRSCVCVVVLSLAIPPGPALAWDAPAGSPPDWRPYWVQTIAPADLYAGADGDLSFGQAVADRFFRVDAPEQRGRLWVFNPLTDGWGWLARSSTQPTDEPTTAQVQASAAPPDPRTYLYEQSPDLAPRLDCIIARESGWDPAQQNPRSRAAGLAQFLPSTWASTPEGQSGSSPFEPLASIDAAIWLAQTRGWSQWQVYAQGYCR